MVDAACDVVALGPGPPIGRRFALESQDDIGAECFRRDEPVSQIVPIVHNDATARLRTELTRLRALHASQKRRSRNLTKKNATLQKQLKRQSQSLVRLQDQQDWSCDVGGAPGKRQPVSRIMFAALKRCSGHTSTRSASTWLHGKLHPSTFVEWEKKCGTSFIAQASDWFDTQLDRLATSEEDWGVAACRYRSDASNTEFFNDSSVRKSQTGAFHINFWPRSSLAHSRG